MGLSDERLKEEAYALVEPIIAALTSMSPEAASRIAETRELEPVGELVFKGASYEDAVENMEKFFLANRMSDGNPIVPPTRARVEAMIAASGLPADHQLGVMEPLKGMTTLELVAINAVMSGCIPAYMPVLVAVAECLIDPLFDLQGVSSTAGQTSPIIFISGPIVKDLGFNYSFATIGPGWKADTTVGGAMRMFLTNIGKSWPGTNDMKEVGNPVKFGIVVAENENQTPAGWGTWRECLGFSADHSIVSLYSAQSFRQFNDSQKNVPHKPYLNVIDPMLIRLMGSVLSNSIEQWGKDLVIAISPSMAKRWASWGYTPEKIQEELYARTGIVRDIWGPVPLGAHQDSKGIPDEWDQKPLDGLVPVVPTPQDFPILVTGGAGADASLLIDRRGAGGTHTTSHVINLPDNWDELVREAQERATPIIVKE